jgi:hypothetical protein
MEYAFINNSRKIGWQQVGTVTGSNNNNKMLQITTRSMEPHTYSCEKTMTAI